MIQEDYVSFETAKLLKEKGFNEACHVFYDSGYEHLLKFVQNGLCNNAGVVANNGICVAPTLQMAMKWLREVYHLFVHIDYSCYLKYCWHIVRISDSYIIKNNLECKYYDTFEAACEAAIKYCLENLI